MREPNPRLLVIKSDPVESDQEIRAFIDAGIKVEGVTDLPRNLQFINRNRPDVIILEDANALELVKKVRVRKALDGISLVMIGKSDGEQEILEALASGVDEYITRPYSIPVLLAKVKSLVRRRNSLRGSEPRILKAGAVTLNLKTQEAHLNHKLVALTQTEFRLLRDLVNHLNSVRTREDLRSEALNNLMVNDRTIDVHIASLRKKLGDFGNKIRTVRGLGYRLIV